MKPGETRRTVAATRLRFEGIVPGPRAELSPRTAAASSLLDADGKPLGEIVSAKRFYPVRQMPTTEAGIRTLGLSQLYVSLGDQSADGGIVVRIWWKPLVTLIWLGGAGDDGGRRGLADRPPAARRRAGAAAAKPEPGRSRP